MNACNKCLKNNWKYEFNKGMVKATCQHCGNVVEFEAKKKVKKKMHAGDLCRKCKTPIIFKKSKFKKSKLKKSYYFTGYYWCPKCKTMYMSEEFKIINKPQEIKMQTIPHSKKMRKMRNFEKKMLREWIIT